MVVFLLKFIFFLVGMLSDLITRVIFGAAAHVLVQMIQMIKGPGEQSQRVLELARDFIKTCLESILGFIISLIGSIFSSLLDKIKEGVVNSTTGVAGTVAEMAEKLRTSLEEALQEAPELMNAFGEMLGKIVSDVLNNCKDALAYVSEKAMN